jgi:anti-sigma B factor antagonist
VVLLRQPSSKGGRWTKDPLFAVELWRPSEHVVVVEVEGEIDISSSRRFKDALSRGISDGAGRLIIDLTNVTFLDSTAIGVVVGGVKDMRALGGTLDIVCPDGSITGIFKTTRLDEILDIYLTRAEALAATDQ